MFEAPIFPEGFRAAASLRGFNLGSSRQPFSEREEQNLENLRGKLACILADCGFAEAAPACPRDSRTTATLPRREENSVESIVQEVLRKLR